MFIDLVDRLRCPVPHADSWLVLSADRVVERTVLEGILGCPVCRAEFPIAAGVVRFNGATPPTRDAVADPAAAMRLAAFLELTDPAALALLAGRWGAHAPAITALTPVQIVVLSPDVRVDAQPGVSPILADGCPIAPGVLAGAALDGSDAADAIVAAVRSGGRLLGPTTMPLPDGVQEIARDEEVWVAERVASLPIVPLGRRRQSGPDAPSE